MPSNWFLVTWYLTSDDVTRFMSLDKVYTQSEEEAFSIAMSRILFVPGMTATVQRLWS